MVLIEWRDDISVGIKSIDKQHMILIDMINEFYRLIKTKSNSELIELSWKNERVYGGSLSSGGVSV